MTEIAFVMKAPLSGPDVSIDDVLNATDHITPALEILDTRIERMNKETGRIRTFFDTISDNAANAGIVVGGRSAGPREADLRWIGAIVSRNGEVEETGLGAGVLDHPAKDIVWLANRLHQYGMQIEAGQVVLSGSFIRPVECRNGDRIVSDFGPHGTIRLSFAHQGPPASRPVRVKLLVSDAMRGDHGDTETHLRRCGDDD